jgi:hypothetical protein
MEPSELVQLSPGAPVWVWIVRLGKGRWWPGTVQSFNVTDGLPNVTVRFEARAPERRNSHPAAVFMGITTTRMRFLELRDLEARGDDRPNQVPVSLLRVPESGILKRRGAEAKHSTANGEVRSAK